MSGSQLIVQTSNFFLMDATAVTLVQDHGKVIHYISPDLYILCTKYLRFSSNVFAVRGKSCWGSGRADTAVKMNWKHSHPRLGWLNDHPVQQHIYVALGGDELTHLPLDNLAGKLQTTFSIAFFSMKTFEFRLKFHWSLFLKVQIDNKSALVQVMAWRWTGDKPLPEPMLTQFTDAYMWH